MVKQCGLDLISKLRTDAALFLPPTTPYKGRGRRAIYGERVHLHKIDKKYLVWTQTADNMRTDVYQMKLRHKKFPDPLNVVCPKKTNLTTKQQTYVLLFSSEKT